MLAISEVFNIVSNYRKYHQIISKFGINDKASLRSSESLTNNQTDCWSFLSQCSGAISHLSTKSLWSRRVQYHELSPFVKCQVLFSVDGFASMQLSYLLLQLSWQLLLQLLVFLLKVRWLSLIRSQVSSLPSFPSHQTHLRCSVWHCNELNCVSNWITYPQAIRCVFTSAMTDTSRIRRWCLHRVTWVCLTNHYSL